MLKKIGVGLKLLPGILKVRLGRPVPLFCQWEVTFRCNMNCVFCPIPQHVHEWQPELNTSESLEMVDQLADIGTKLLNLGGGEPLLRPDLFKIAARAKQRGMHVFVNSNGYLVEENIGKIEPGLFDFFRISVDGTPGFHDRVRKFRGAYNAAFKAVKLLKKKGVGCMINSVVTKDTRPEMLFEMLEKAKGLGIKVSLTPAIHSLPCVENPGREDVGDDLRETLVAIPNFAKVLRAARERFPETVDDPSAYWDLIKKGGLEKYGCRAMDITIGIKPDGRVSFPCTDFPAKAVKGRLKEVYYGKEAKRQRRMQGNYWFCKNCFSRCDAFPTMLLSLAGTLSLLKSWDSL
jgi:MoaA/NifB/PqqE/SkfB family radical SAM enzyme